MSAEDKAKDPVDLTAAAERTVDKLVKAVRRNRLWNTLLSALVVLIILLGFGQWHGSVESCQAGNRSRATNEAAWDSFINLLINNPNTARTRASLLTATGKLGLPAGDVQGLDDIINANWTNDPANVALAKSFESYIAQNEYPVNCTSVWRG